MKRHLESVYGKSVTWRATVEDPPGSGTRVDLTGRALRFTAKRNYSDPDPPLVDKVATNQDQTQAATKGQADVKLSVAEATLAGVSPGAETTLVWELTLEDGAERQPVARGTWTLLPTVDRP